MATVTYKCDTCKRSIDLIENKNGLTQFSKCVITTGCRGKLYKTGYNPDNVRESNLPYIPGLQNYQKRKAFFSYTQTIEKAEWKINHNMGVAPAVTVYEDISGNLIEVGQKEYSVIIVDRNNIILKFNTQKKGLVHLIARTTDSTINFTADSENQFIITNQGVFTFAIPVYITIDEGADNPDSEVTSPPLPFFTCDSENKVYIEVELTIPNSETVFCIEELDSIIDSRSAWNTWNTIIINNRKKYCVKTINILNFKSFGNPDIKIDEIPFGTTVKITRVDYGTGKFVNIPSKGLLSLLTAPPYTPFDKIKDKVLDVGETFKLSDTAFVFNGDEFQISESFVEKIYPEISKVNIVEPSPPSIIPSP